MTIHFTKETLMPESSVDTALRLIELLEKAYDATAGGKYRGYNLAVEIRALGIRMCLPAAAPEPRSLHESSSDLGHGD